ncbi:CdaR family protein [Patiriisocius hiemis]|uniref:CdaR family protein n=1 Tax=Patiriisocius hiemis TaxID=3075604 RepID=A0ABU2YAE2_9FLAO|nr:CdaR family protein [Constantimarinum sp. W242]MDT0555154.1 CdaR family protein [Constantimarinum sp. W242]
MQKAKRNYRATKLKSFFFFLLLAVVLWLLTKFSQEQTVSLITQVRYTNIPVSSQLSENNISKLSFDATTNGFEFLMLSLKNPSVEISITDYLSDEDSLVSIDQSELKQIIQNQIGKNLEVKNLSVSSIDVLLNALVSKEVPVALDNQVSFKKGFKTIQEVTITPNKVIVVGPNELLTTIDSIKTKPFKLNNVNSSFSEEVLLINPNPNLKLETYKVVVAATVEEFTAHNITVPIDIRNAPPDKKIKLIPENIKISFVVSMSNFNSISKSDFSIICDFNTADKNQSFLIPEIAKSPEGISNIELSHNKINYLIFK